MSCIIDVSFYFFLVLDIDHGLVIDKPPTIDLSDEEGDYGTKFAR